jgi:hypothetical protein
MTNKGNPNMEETNQGGFQCPSCGCRHHSVTNTWQREVRLKGKLKTIIRRRRVCRHCSLPFTTIETHEEDLTGDLDLSPKKPPEDTGALPNPFL